MKFDTTKPHTHHCSRCYSPVYCRAVNCEIPRFAECLPCKRAPGYSSCEKDLDAVEPYTPPFGKRRNRRRENPA